METTVTIEEFTDKLADPSYREYIRTHAFAGTLPPDEELLLLECSLGEPAPVRLTPLQALSREMAQKWPERFGRTTPWPKTPWPTVLLMLVRAYRARPGYIAPATATEEAAAIRDEALRHVKKWPTCRHQLADIVRLLDDMFPEAKEVNPLPPNLPVTR